MDTTASLIEAFDVLNERKRRDPESLTKLEKARWRMMRCEIEEALFQRTRDPATDTREFLRVPVSLQVRYRVSKDLKESYVPILGEGGMFITTTEPCPKGWKLDLEIIPRGKSMAFTVKGEVVWSDQKSAPKDQGMGIKFFDLTERQKQLLYTLVDDAIRQGLLERRRFARIDTRIDVQIEQGMKTASFETHDLSLGGMHVAANLPVKIGEPIFFEMRLPGQFPSVKGKAKVIHITEKPSPDQRGGFGVEFVDLGIEEAHSIRRYMSQRVCGEIRHARDEPRKHARLKRRIKLRFQAVNAFGTTDASDISGGGVFIQSREPPPRGSKVEVNLIHPVTLHTIGFSGTVVRVVEADPKVPSRIPGVGVAFDDMGDVKMDLYKEFLTDLVALDSVGY